MSSPDRPDIEAILDDLYASEISASISWVWDTGFYVTLGSPIFAEKPSAASIREAVEWLRDQALDYYPESDFARKYAGV
jgi:hypothetical protein